MPGLSSFSCEPFRNPTHPKPRTESGEFLSRQGDAKAPWSGECQHGGGPAFHKKIAWIVSESGVFWPTRIRDWLGVHLGQSGDTAGVKLTPALPPRFPADVKSTS